MIARLSINYPGQEIPELSKAICEAMISGGFTYLSEKCEGAMSEQSRQILSFSAELNIEFAHQVQPTAMTAKKQEDVAEAKKFPVPEKRGGAPIKNAELFDDKDAKLPYDGDDELPF